MHLFCINQKDIHKFEEILLSDDQKKKKIQENAPSKFADVCYFPEHIP